MDELQERYDDLDNIETTLRILIHDINIQEKKEDLMQIMFDAQEEKEEIRPRLLKMYDEEEKEQERQYWKDKI